MKTMKLLFTLLSLAALSALSLSCDAIECGEGTIEQNGACVPADTVNTNDLCGEGTYYDDGTFACLPEFPPTVCGPNTSWTSTTAPSGTISPDRFRTSNRRI